MSLFYGTGFGLVFGRLAILKTAQPKLLLAIFEGRFFYGQKYSSVRSKKLHEVNLRKLYIFLNFIMNLKKAIGAQSLEIPHRATDV